MKKLVVSMVLVGMGILIGLSLNIYFMKAQLTISPENSSTVPTIPPSSSGGSGFVTANSFISQTSVATNNAPLPQASGEDPSIHYHTHPDGGRGDIIQIGTMTVSQPEAYTGDDITFTITLQNVASYKKFVRSVCFNSEEGNFGCSPGFNLSPGQVLSISNSGRFTSSGLKFIQVSWSQDGVNYLSPVNGSGVSVRIL